MTHNAEEWRRLRSEFIEAAAKYDEYETFIERQTESEDWYCNNGRYHTVGRIRWPYGSYRKCWILASDSGEDGEPFSAMKTLFAKAWLRLPRDIADEVVDTAKMHLSEAPSPPGDTALWWAKSYYQYWCWLLWFHWLRQLRAANPTEAEKPSKTMVMSPFHCSADLIAQWGLDGSDVTLPEWLSPPTETTTPTKAKRSTERGEDGEEPNLLPSDTEQDERKAALSYFMLFRQVKNANSGDLPVISSWLDDFSTDVPDGSHESENVFTREGNTWTIRFNGGETHRGLADVKAVPDIHFLLGHEFEVEIEDLPANIGFKEMTKSVPVATKDDFKDLLKQISQLRHDLAEEHDQLVKEEIEQQIKALEKQLNENFDNQGKPRELSGDRRKVIEATQTRINRWYKDNQGQLPDLIAHLMDRLSISSKCSYRRDDSISWELGKK